MKIAIIGTGGVGGYFGGKLAKAGYDVTFLARGKHLRAIQQNGLIVKSVLGDFKVDSMKATDRIETIGFSDLIIITVKAWQIKDITKDLKTIIKNDTIVLPLQNGVLAAEELKENIKQENIIGGLCRIISKIESPGVINHFGIEPTILFGELDNSKTERILKINAKISDDIVVDLWKKFIPICVSGLLAITNTTYGELRELSETRQLMIELLNEIFRLSQKIGIKIESAYLDKAITFIDSFPYDSTSSLTRDVWEGKPSEIEYQNGTVVRLGKELGIDTPVNKFIYGFVKLLEKKYKNQSV